MTKTEFILKTIRKICPYSNIGTNTELIESGILTSIDLFDLIVQFETELDIRIPEELITAENFSTVEIIASTVLSGGEC